MAKTYKTKEELFKYLRESKNIKNIHSFADVFDERTYVSIINPYKLIFASGVDNESNHIYDEPVDFEKYLQLIRIDENISLKLHNLIGKLERHLKNIVIKTICDEVYTSGDYKCNKYPTILKHYIDKTSTDNPYNLVKINEFYNKKGKTIVLDDNHNSVTFRKQFIQKLIDLGTNKAISKNTLIKHYQSSNEVVPLWLLAQEFSFGELITLYNMLSNSKRNEINSEISTANISRLSRVDNFVFYNKLSEIKKIRNTINHYEPLFPAFLNLKNKTLFNQSLLLLKRYDKETSNFKYIQFDANKYTNDYNKKIIQSLNLFLELQK